MATLIVDSSPLYATLDRRDGRHADCSHLLREHVGAFVVPAPVLTEVDHFVRKNLHRDVHQAFLEDIVDGTIHVEELREVDYQRIAELCRTYDDLDLGLVDASVVAIAERLNEKKIATLDRRHFSVIRPRHVDAFELLPA